MIRLNWTYDVAKWLEKDTFKQRLCESSGNSCYEANCYPFGFYRIRRSSKRLFWEQECNEFLVRNALDSDLAAPTFGIRFNSIMTFVSPTTSTAFLRRNSLIRRLKQNLDFIEASNILRSVQSPSSPCFYIKGKKSVIFPSFCIFLCFFRELKTAASVAACFEPKIKAILFLSFDLICCFFEKFFRAFKFLKISTLIFLAVRLIRLNLPAFAFIGIK